MQIQGTRQAFLQMLQTRGIYKQLGVSIPVVSNWKRALKGVDTANMPSLDKMEEMLIKAGAKVVQEKIWEIQ